MNNNNCIVCDNIIDALNSKGTLYRCGDANVCSAGCSHKRFCELKIINPRLNEPLSWNTSENKLSKTKSTLFCSDTCIIIGAGDYDTPNIDKTIYGTIRNIFVRIIINMIDCITK